ATPVLDHVRRHRPESIAVPRRPIPVRQPSGRTRHARDPGQADVPDAPYHQHDKQARSLADLRSLGIPRIGADPNLAAKRPNIPLRELTGGRAGSLLSLIDRWITDFQHHAQAFLT